MTAISVSELHMYPHNQKSCPIFFCITHLFWSWHDYCTDLILRESTLNSGLHSNKVMRRHYVCLHTNLHDQTSHFHLYVNAEYVNKPCGTRGRDSCWGRGFIICTPFDPEISRRTLHPISFTTHQLSRQDRSQLMGNISPFHSFTGAGSGFLGR